MTTEMLTSVKVFGMLFGIITLAIFCGLAVLTWTARQANKRSNEHNRAPSKRG